MIHKAPGTTRWQRLRWPILLTSLLVAQAAGIVGMVVISARDPSFAVEPDYYQKALAWDQTQQQNQAGAALGWKVEAATAPATPGRDLVITLRDALGRPLEGASIRAEVFHHARAADRQAVTLAPAGDGAYRAPATLNRAGIWEVSLSITRGPDTLHTSRQLSLESAAP